MDGRVNKCKECKHWTRHEPFGGRSVMKEGKCDGMRLYVSIRGDVTIEPSRSSDDRSVSPSTNQEFGCNRFEARDDVQGS